MSGVTHPIVVATFPGFDPDDAATGGALRAAGCELRLEPRTRERSLDEVRALMRDAFAGIVSTDRFDATVFAACPRLRILARVGVGYDTIDVDAATAAGIAVTTTPGANAETVADHALALMLAATRRIVEEDAAVRRGAWLRGGAHAGWDLHGRTIGIVGLGVIGRAVARRLRGFDCRLLAYDIAPQRVDGVELVRLDELLRRADVITVHVPLLPGTRRLIGAAELALLRPGAILVNTSRGGVVDEAACAAALRDGRLRAAGIDVFEDEPPAASPLLGLPNVTLTPHVAGISVGSIGAMLGAAVHSVLAVLHGERPDGLLNPEALAG
jgi:phosphoglycerate dehydrogenase-like enzyme